MESNDPLDKYPKLREFLEEAAREMRRENTPTYSPRGGFGFAGSHQWDSRPKIQRWMYPPSASEFGYQVIPIPRFNTPGFSNPKVPL